MPELPDWYPDRHEAKPAPMPLLLVQAFVNTRELEGQTDLLGDPDAASSWLVAAGLLGPDSSIGSDGLDLARAVRESIRGLLESDGGERPPEAELNPLRALAEAHCARLVVGDGGVLAVENAKREDLADGLFDLLLIIRGAQEDGTWARLRACANPDCRWVFYDRSRNQQGNWCDMAVCGNRLKNRSLRARRR
jgi:predicted RNA-binding Zn ribbon-like protein